jgi:hypothetical protein
MRLLTATLTLVFLAGPAYSQNMGGAMGGKGGGKGQTRRKTRNSKKPTSKKRRPLTTLTRLG